MKVKMFLAALFLTAASAHAVECYKVNRTSAQDLSLAASEEFDILIKDSTIDLRLKGNLLAFDRMVAVRTIPAVGVVSGYIGKLGRHATPDSGVFSFRIDSARLELIDGQDLILGIAKIYGKNPLIRGSGLDVKGFEIACSPEILDLFSSTHVR